MIKIIQVYYIANEKQYKKVLVNLAKECEEVYDFPELGIFGCNYVDDGFGECQCGYCESDECLLSEHLEDKDVVEHMIINDVNGCDYPAILVIADTYDKEDRVTLIPVYETKDNTKYGYDGYW